MRSDSTGKLWMGRVCPDCRNGVSTNKYARKKGHLHVDAVTEHKNKKGRDAERIAEIFFKNKGFDVKINSGGAGPDLIISKGSFSASVEVKSVTTKLSKNLIPRFVTGPVYHTRKSDDLIAIVHDGKVHVELMSKHVHMCNKSGQRAVTKIVRSM